MIGTPQKLEAVPYALTAAKADTAAVATDGLWANYAVITETTPDGVASSNNFSANATWQTVTLNQAQVTGVGISRTGNTINLAKGKYHVRAINVFGYDVGANNSGWANLRFRNTSLKTTAINGPNQ